jgi:CBS domain containing-hemolysin-like protein
MLTLAKEPLDRFATSIARLPSVPQGVSKDEVYRLTRRQQQPTVLVTEPHGRRVIGYVHVLDLKLQPGDVVDSVRTMIEIPKTESPVSALMRMQSSDRDLARLVDERGRTIGILGSGPMLDQLLRNAS